MNPERPRNKISHNWTKPTPFRRARRIDFVYIIFSANGHYMQKLSCFDQFPKHTKSQTSQSQHVVFFMSTI
jgi:hypothetical protein